MGVVERVLRGRGRLALTFPNCGFRVSIASERITNREYAVGIEHFDVLIVGAGLSGVGAAYHLQTECPGKSFAILEGRNAIGGTWDLFRYPGIRSDSDMYTLGYAFKPWKEAKAIADGPSILNYVRETAAENGIDKHIRFGHRVTSAAWSSTSAYWTITAMTAPDAAPVIFTCSMLMMCNGYYNYDAGHEPEFPGAEQFEGQIVHPQKWPAALDYAYKKIVVIGSGATAVTLVPELGKTAASVTMLQRSPSYIMSMPSVDKIANNLRDKLPAMLAYRLIRWKNILLTMFLYIWSRKKPDQVKQNLINMLTKQLPPGFDVQRHFTPNYNPWDQRLCLVPDADLFKAIRSGRANVATDTIKTFTKTGIELNSGEILEADIIVTATGLKMHFLSGLKVTVDGTPIDFSNTLTYKGMMYSGVPNLVSVFGYTNASWTLKADLTCEYVCRLINHMDQHGFGQCTPERDATVEALNVLDFTPGYITRALDQLPKQGVKKPWRLYQNYALDLMALRFGKLEDGVMAFKRTPVKHPEYA